MNNDFFKCIFLHSSPDDIVELSIGGVLPSNRMYTTVQSLGDMDHSGMEQVFFGPGVRKERSTGTKDNFAGTSVVWMDYDAPTRPVHIFPESIAVSSGNGWHMYWILDKLCTRVDQIEAVNKGIASALGGDSAYDAPRLLRVPGTINTKNGSACKVVSYITSRVYDLKSLYISSQIQPSVTKLILSGGTGGYKSRSERDWYIIKALVDAGMDDTHIEYIFHQHPCGDKYAEDGSSYLEHTIKRAREAPKTSTTQTGIVESNNSYYRKTSGGMMRISSFIFRPVLLLESEDQDWIMGNIHAYGTSHVWNDVVIPKSAFSSSNALTKILTKASWGWLGRDSDVRLLLQHIIEQLQDMDVPRAHATYVLGKCSIPGDDRSFYVSSNGVISSSGETWMDFKDSPLVYVDPDREAPRIVMSMDEPDPDVVEQMVRYLIAINEPEVIWPMIGWFMATPFKPDFLSKRYKFPILNVSGTRGSGKSTMIQDVFQPLMGFEEPRAYNAATTYFVVLTLLGSSYTVPVAFTEFRSAATTGFNRFVLQSYDTGRDPRGHADQSTTDYPLIAPFCVDGEDMLDDPAALERIVSVQPNVTTVVEGSDAYTAFQQLCMMDLRSLATPYHRYSLSKDINLLLDQAEEDIYETFPDTVPSRIRKNLTLCWCGVLLFLDFLNTTYGVEIYPDGGASVMRRSLDNVYSTDLGRAPTAADSFVETVVNGASKGTGAFPWKVENGVLWFQLTTAYEYWAGNMARQRRSVLSEKAIRSQVLEMSRGGYMEPGSVQVIKGKSITAFGVNLQAAYEAGLDIPKGLASRQLVIDL